MNTIDACTHICVYTYVYVCMHTHIYMHAHTISTTEHRDMPPKTKKLRWFQFSASWNSVFHLTLNHSATNLQTSFSPSHAHCWLSLQRQQGGASQRKEALQDPPPGACRLLPVCAPWPPRSQHTECRQDARAPVREPSCPPALLGRRGFLPLGLKCRPRFIFLPSELFLWKNHWAFIPFHSY